jgi:hypothetical protein
VPAAGGDARLVRRILRERISGWQQTQGSEEFVHAEPGGQQGVGEKEPLCVRDGPRKLVEPAKGPMHAGEGIIALAPSVSRPAKMRHSLSGGRAEVSCSEQSSHSGFINRGVATLDDGRENGSCAQKQAVPRERHCWIDVGVRDSCAPSPPQLILKHPLVSHGVQSGTFGSA